MSRTKRMYKKSKKVFSKSKKLRKSKKNRSTKNRSTKKRTVRGGYTFLENFNLKKYSEDPKVQLALESHFNEPNVVGNPEKALQILKANNNLYKSIKDLMRDIGLGADSSEASKEKLEIYESKTPAMRERQREMEEGEEKSLEARHERELMPMMARLKQEQMAEERRKKEMAVYEARRKKDEANAEYLRKQPKTSSSISTSRRSYNSSNRQ